MVGTSRGVVVVVVLEERIHQLLNLVDRLVDSREEERVK